MEKQETIYLPFLRLNPEKLLGGNTHYRIHSEQIIFHYKEWDCFVITTIDDDKEYSIQSYETLPEGAPFQLINGKLVYMAPPSLKHQNISLKLTRYLDQYIDEHELGRLFVAPTGVELGEDSVVEPDLLFISIRRKEIANESEMRIKGAPDFIVEILSTNADDDRIRKMELYAEHDVLEYWIVDPFEESVEVYQNQDKKMQLIQKAMKDDVVKSIVIDGFELALAKVFVW